MPDFDPPTSPDDAGLQRALRTDLAGDPPGLARRVAEASATDLRRAAARLREAERGPRPLRPVLATAALVLLGVGVAVFAALRSERDETGDRRPPRASQDPLPALETEPVEPSSWDEVLGRLDDVAEIHVQAAWLRQTRSPASVQIDVAGLSGFRARVHTEDRGSLLERIRAAMPGDELSAIDSFRATYWLEFHLTSGEWIRAAAWAGKGGRTALAFDNAGQIGIELPTAVAEKVAALQARVAEKFAQVDSQEALEEVSAGIEILVCRDQRAVDLAARLPDLVKLREVILEGTSPTSELVAVLGRCDRLTSIELRAPALDLATLLDLGPLAQLRSLRRLGLTGLRIDPGDIARLAPLRDLVLESCALEAPGLDGIAPLALQRLALIDPVGLEPGAPAALAGLGNLEDLSLGLSAATDIEAALQAALGLRQLTRLSLRCPRSVVPQALVDRLRQREGLTLELAPR